MKVTRFEDPGRFREHVQPWLLRREAENNYLISLLPRIEERAAEKSAHAPGMYSLDDADGSCAAVALWSDPVVTVTNAALGGPAALANAMADQSDRPTGVAGPTDASNAFARAWSERTGDNSTPTHAMRVYQLTEVIAPKSVPGSMRLAVQADLPLLTEWVKAFNTVLSLNDDDAASHARMRIERGRTFFWTDPDPVTTASAAGPTPSGIRINLVYTPPETRRRGYASACVAALAQQLLEGGRKSIFLFADCDNPTANHIYQAIGFRKVCDWQHHRFSAAPPLNL